MYVHVYYNIGRGVAKLPLPRMMMSFLAMMMPRLGTREQEEGLREKEKEESFQKLLCPLLRVQKMKQLNLR